MCVTKILCDAIEARQKTAAEDETRYFKDYMKEAVAYIDEHLQEEDLSIVSVAGHIYLNPVYFGRVFKNTFHMTFKKYLMQQRMEKAKRLLERGTEVSEISVRQWVFTIRPISPICSSSIRAGCQANIKRNTRYE